ncbi:PREDICTED: CKLF-like MARVEL transmembrane domain-containing protein 6 [Cariama cristata]|nr:PREDICTED: CKLF-like MARVEL transmembrane domain-containing protein 6 [Cariama cristata]
MAVRRGMADVSQERARSPREPHFRRGGGKARLCSRLLNLRKSCNSGGKQTWCLTTPSSLQVQILSLLAVICEEIVQDCIECGGLYFFEFVSCSAFLLSLLILCAYCTDIYETSGEDKVQRVNCGAVTAIGVCFLLASIVLAATSSGSAVEKAACVFGFLASGAFVAEIITERFHSQKQNVDGRSENPSNTQSATESQPLNK